MCVFNKSKQFSTYRFHSVLTASTKWHLFHPHHVNPMCVRVRQSNNGCYTWCSITLAVTYAVRQIAAKNWFEHVAATASCCMFALLQSCAIHISRAQGSSTESLCGSFMQLLALLVNTQSGTFLKCSRLSWKQRCAVTSDSVTASARAPSSALVLPRQKTWHAAEVFACSTLQMSILAWFDTNNMNRQIWRNKANPQKVYRSCSHKTTYIQLIARVFTHSTLMNFAWCWKWSSVWADCEVLWMFSV